jgi:hypothetical protein
VPTVCCSSQHNHHLQRQRAAFRLWRCVVEHWPSWLSYTRRKSTALAQHCEGNFGCCGTYPDGRQPVLDVLGAGCERAYSTVRFQSPPPPPRSRFPSPTAHSPPLVCNLQTEIRYCSITAKRDDAHKHDLYDLTAFNTDGQCVCQCASVALCNCTFLRLWRVYPFIHLFIFGTIDFAKALMIL